MSNVLIDGFYPDRNFQEMPSVTRRLSELGAVAIWLPYSPDAQRELEADGYFHLFSYKGLQLKIGQETPRGLQSFEDRLLGEADALKKVAVLSRKLDAGEDAVRQVWVVGRPGFSD